MPRDKIPFMVPGIESDKYLSGFQDLCFGHPGPATLLSKSVAPRKGEVAVAFLGSVPVANAKGNYLPVWVWRLPRVCS